MPSPCHGSRAAQLNRQATGVRVLGLLLRMAVYIATSVAVVLAFGTFAALLPGLFWLVLPSSFEHADLGLISLAAGFIGLFIGLWPAILSIEWLAQRHDRRAQERSPRSSESQA